MNSKVYGKNGFQIQFCNQPQIELKDVEVQKEIISSIQKMGTYNIESKYYDFLNYKNVNQINETDFKICTSSFGKKYNLYLKNINNKNYCIFLNKKTKQMILGKFTFALSLFDGTLMDGELVKNSRNEWFFLINDLIYYEGKNMIIDKFENRQKILQNMIESQYRHESSNHCKIFIKKYVDMKYMNDFVKVYIPKLSYKCSGLVFRNIYNFSSNYTYIFPECRTDTQILGGKSTLPESNVKKEVDTSETYDISKDKIYSVSKEEENMENMNFFDYLSKECEVVSYHDEEKKEDDEKEDEKDDNKYQINSDTYCKFLVKSTEIPDIYELYCRSATGNIEKHSYASIPNMSTSLMMRNLFPGKSSLVMRCKYNKIFKKWYPYEVHHRNNHESVDYLYQINKVKIIVEKIEDDDI
jgi:hypothetical protein